MGILEVVAVLQRDPIPSFGVPVEYAPVRRCAFAEGEYDSPAIMTIDRVVIARLEAYPDQKMRIAKPHLPLYCSGPQLVHVHHQRSLTPEPLPISMVRDVSDFFSTVFVYVINFSESWTPHTAIDTQQTANMIHRKNQ